ncbi:MAG: hypothetical protein JO243_10405 [Solirubrobacterales bacterium]|nr:hypothetical protein [Solirubrobacterales bacterium]
MPTLQFEHSIKDFAMWKAAFDRDPIDRRGLGVRRHRIYRTVGDPHYVIGELEFDSVAEAQVCANALQQLWKSRQAAPALLGTPQVRIVETVEELSY